MSKPQRGAPREVPALGLATIDPTPWVALLSERFGVAPEVFDAYLWHSPNPKLIAIVARDHEPPLRPAPLSIGLPFLRTNMQHPKMTTGGTLLLGHLATRHTVELNAEQMALYFQRGARIPLLEAQLGACESLGYVIARHHGVTLGQGIYFDANAERDAVLRSLYPKAFTNRVERSALDASSPG